MAKAKGSRTASVSTKTTFGKRKGGKASKVRNKHNKSERNYRGQGR